MKNLKILSMFLIVFLTLSFSGTYVFALNDNTSAAIHHTRESTTSPLPSVDDNVSVKIPSFNVKLNNTLVESTKRQYPLITYKDITYVPMTYYDCRYLGLSTRWDNDTRTLAIEKADISCAYRDYSWEQENESSHIASVCDINLIINGKSIDNKKEEYPILSFRDVTYFPLTWHFAAEEFGWNYLFDSENGLSVQSHNHHTRTITLPHMTKGAATDGVNYYYNGVKDDKNVIYMVPVSDLSEPVVICELPDTDMSKSASFTTDEGKVYFSYYAGSSPIMSTYYSFCISPDGTVSEGYPRYYSVGKHGYSEVNAREDEITVKGVNSYVDSATEFTYTINGVETKAQLPVGRVRIGRRREVNDTRTGAHDCIKIYKDKIYYTGINLEDEKGSALYCIDTKTGKTQKLIEGVCGFHVYTGWINGQDTDSVMIIYDKDGVLMRYAEVDNTIKTVDDNNRQILEMAVGDYMVYTLQKSPAGDRTLVKAHACYADGTGSINGDVLLDTDTGTYCGIMSDSLWVTTNGESAEDAVRFIVAGADGLFLSSDVAESIFIYENTILYMTDSNILVRVDLNRLNS